MEVLEQGGTTRGNRPRMPGWLGRMALAAVLAGTAFAALPSLRVNSSAPAGPPADQPTDQPAGLQAPPGPPVPIRQPGDPGLHTSAVILLRTPDAVVVDVDTGLRIPLPDAVDWTGGGDTLLLGRTVVTVIGSGSLAAADHQVVALTPDGGLTRLGFGSRVLAATSDSVWVIRRDGNTRTVALVGLDGKTRLRARPLPRSVDVSGTTAGRQLIVGSRWPGEPGPLMLWAPATGQVVRTLAPEAIVHSSNGRHVVWSACSQCPLVVTDLPDRRTRPLGLYPAGPAIAGRVRLSPDGQHYAVLLSPAGNSGKFDLAVGHLPGTQRAGAVTTPLRTLATRTGRRPRLSYARSGWLFVSTGDRVYAVGPGPHSAVALETLPRHERLAAS